jgi:hypothetical protein
MRYTTEVELALAVEILDVARGAAATRATPPEPDYVALCVRLGPLEVTDALPVEVLAGLEEDALERLRAAADEP